MYSRGVNKCVQAWLLERAEHPWGKVKGDNGG